MTTPKSEAEKIAEINDLVRQTLVRDRLFLTIGVQGLGQETLDKVLNAIETYDNFNPSNDPHKEHDFGEVKVDGKTLFFKLDYFDNNLEYHSPDVLDRSVTRRVMTLMLAEEY